MSLNHEMTAEEARTETFISILDIMDNKIIEASAKGQVKAMMFVERVFVEDFIAEYHKRGFQAYCTSNYVAPRANEYEVRWDKK